MSRSLITLALGGKLGLEFLTSIEPRSGVNVVPGDALVASAASRLGFKVSKSVPESSYLLSMRFPRILNSVELERVQQPVNIHPGYLPMYRGMRPSFWAIYENGPAGVTVHKMKPRIDSGPIYTRELVPYGPLTSGGELQVAISIVEVERAKEFWKYMSDGYLPEPIYVDEPEGVLRTLSDFVYMRDNPPLEILTPDQVLRLVRALSHPEFDLPTWATSL